MNRPYAFGHSLQEQASAVVTAQGGKVLGAARHPIAATDFASFLISAQNSKAQVVGLANAGGDTVNTIKAAREFGLTTGKNKQTLPACSCTSTTSTPSACAPPAA